MSRRDPGRRPPEKSWLLEQYLHRGRSAQELAQETGWSSQYIRDRLRTAGVTLRPPGQPKSKPVDIKVLQEWLADGLSVIDIASRSGYSPTGIYKLIRAHNLTLPRQLDPLDDSMAGRRADVDLVSEVGRRYAAGESLKAIGGSFGYGPDWARARVVAAGVALRGGGRRRQVTRPDPDDLAEAVAAGRSVAEIAAQSGASKDAVRGWIREAGMGFPSPAPRRRTLPLLDPDLLRERYVDGGLSVAQVAAELGVNSGRVMTGLKAAGIPRRHRNAVDRQPPVPLDVTRLRVLYVEEGRSGADVARELGVTPNRVMAALKRLGIPIRAAAEGRPRPPALDIDAETLRRLYVGQRLGDQEIAARYEVPTDRVRRLRRALGVYRDSAEPPHLVRPVTPGRQRLLELYVDQGHTLAQIATAHHTGTPTVRDWMREAGIPTKPRTRRTHRRPFDADQLRVLYVDREWSAAQIAAELDTTINLVLRALHDHGIPVRHKKTQARSTARSTERAASAEEERQLLTTLYADPDVKKLLARHQLPARPKAGPIADRFPTPAPLTRQLLQEAYTEVGLTARHLELLTGQPADQILDALHAAEIPVRTGSGVSPWLSRHLR